MNRSVVARGGPPFHVPFRTALSLGETDWCYGNVPRGPLAMSVDRVRWELAEHYDGAVWAEGYQVDPAGMPLCWVEVLVSVDALRRAVVPVHDPQQPDNRIR